MVYITYKIKPNEKHQLFADTEEIEAIVVCAPTWEINGQVEK